MDTETRIVVQNIPKMTYADLTGFAEGIQQALDEGGGRSIEIDEICEALLSTSQSWLDVLREE